MVGHPRHVLTWFCVGLLAPLALFGIGLWVFGLLSADDERPSTASPDEVATTERQSVSEFNRGQATTLPSDLESLTTLKDDYTRSVALRVMLSKSDQQQVTSLLEQSKRIQPDDRKLTTQIEIFRRFAVIDPLEALKHTFDIAWNRRRPIVNAIFLEWATTDIDAAIAHAKTLGSADRRAALGAILRIQDDFSEDRIQELALEFGHESIGTEVFEQIQIARASHDPRSAWNALLEDATSDEVQSISLGTILQLWVAREGFDVVPEAMESISQIDYPSGILDPILTPIAQEDPQHAFKLINELNENARQAGAFIVVAEWAKNDPSAAFEAVSEVDIRPLHVKDNLMQNIGHAWAENAPYEAFQNLPKYLPSSSLQWIRGSAFQHIVRESVQDALDILNEFPNGVEELGRALVEEWAATDARSALNWIGLQEESLQSVLLRPAIPSLVETDPDLAMSAALNQTIADGQVGLEFEVIRILAQTDIDRATEMLAQVRDHDETKKRSYSELGSALVRQDESSVAIELGSDLPESFQDDYYRSVINSLYNTDQVELYEVLDLLPQRKYQQEAARYLIRDRGLGNYSHRYLTDEQLEEIRTFL
ncbi:MAG: hypothetical protein F4W92_07375 [Gammaproteobacteria bacterium]|nr:hypothetical protein [Gammaproteobacteria bacterium]